MARRGPSARYRLLDEQRKAVLAAKTEGLGFGRGRARRRLLLPFWRMFYADPGGLKLMRSLLVA